jgi:hypothetical protein
MLALCFAFCSTSAGWFDDELSDEAGGEKTGGVAELLCAYAAFALAGSGSGIVDG